MIDVGVAVVEIFGEIVESWLSAEEEEELGGVGQKSSELSSRQILVGGELGKKSGYAAADGHGVIRAVCGRFRGLRLWLGTDNLHPRIFDGLGPCSAGAM